jgi:Protein of unknown function (DUF1214)
MVRRDDAYGNDIAGAGDDGVGGHGHDRVEVARGERVAQIAEVVREKTPNDLKRYSLGAKSKTLRRDTDKSLTIYAGAKSPGKDHEANWLPAPEGHFSLYIRAYWGKRPILDGSWKPPAVTKIH